LPAQEEIAPCPGIQGISGHLHPERDPRHSVQMFHNIHKSRSGQEVPTTFAIWSLCTFTTSIWFTLARRRVVMPKRERLAVHNVENVVLESALQPSMSGTAGASSPNFTRCVVSSSRQVASNQQVR
jgi:hypothetical protein